MVLSIKPKTFDIKSVWDELDKNKFCTTYNKTNQLTFRLFLM